MAQSLDCFAQFILSTCKVVEGLAMTKISLILFAVLLAGCGDDRPPTPTAEEADQLNEAEAMLNAEGAE